MPPRVLSLAVAVPLWLCLGVGGQPAKKPLTVDDLYRLESPSATVLSPDGRNAVYVRQWIDDRKRERHSLWIIEGAPDKHRALEKDEPDARAPVHSADGKWIAFVSTRPRPDGWKQTPPVPAASDPAADLWLLPTAGGPAIPLAGPDKPYGRVFHDGYYGNVAFSPDGNRLVFVADDGKDPRTKEEIDNDVEIVRPDQGEGYTGYGPAQIWVAHLDEKPEKFAAKRIDRLTDDDVWYGDPRWSPDGKRLAVHANRSDDRESVRFSINKNFDIWLLDPETKKLRQLTTGPGPEVSPRWSPDGKQLVCLSVPRKGSHRDVFNLAIITLGDSGARTEIVFDHHNPDTPGGLAPTFPLPADCWDGPDHFIYSSDAGFHTVTARLDRKTGKSTLLDIPSRSEKPDPDTPGGRRALVQRLLPSANPFLRERQRSVTREVSWGSEGLTIEALLALPPEGVGKPPYPLILYPHGGPHSRAALGFNFTVEVFAASGYAVLQPNFRGSFGYGQKFIDADRFDLGGGDMRDILNGIDHLVKRKVIDRDRQYVYGTSYGGFMTCWLVGHTNQFKAAVAQNPVTDLNAMWGLTDIPSWTEWEFGGRPWEVPAAMRKHSPLTYAVNVRTPTLILHARDDRRCPLPMGRMFHQALRANKVETEMVIYPGEGHGIRQPKHRVDVLRRTLDWFDKHN
jgi:dipeptidyl aminopeptidase/acylaminoacyl peptidase